MAVLRLLTFVTDVSIFALNLLLAMGLALAIDYTLLIISRFRDELGNGAERDAALVRTMASAGRSVLFSAMTVALSMSALVFFPMPFLKSFAYAGNRGGGPGGRRGDCGDARRDRAARPAIGLHGSAAAGGADVLLPVSPVRDAPGGAARAGHRRCC